MMDDITIRDYIDMRCSAIVSQIKGVTALIEQHFKLDDMAAKKAEESMQLRLEGMNEFRAQINSERINYVSKELLSKELILFDSRLKRLEAASAFSSGKWWVVSALIGLVPTACASLALYIALKEG